MNKYKVTITETLQKEIIIEADSLQHAINKAQDGYRDEKYVLYPEDWTDTSYDAELVRDRSNREREER